MDELYFSTKTWTRLFGVGISEALLIKVNLTNTRLLGFFCQSAIALYLVTFGLSTFVIISIGFILLLSVLGIPIAPVLAGAGIAGLAISLASQNLIKDIINGTLILLEDHYAVGDYISVAGITGLVEKMNLRLTQIRDIRGTLSTIPHRAVNIVQNQSKDWSRINFTTPFGLKSEVVMSVVRNR